VAIASRSAERATEAARRAGIPKAFGSYEALLDDPEVDAVYNPLPNAAHDLWTRKAADRGKHILCEKPLTPSAPEAAALVDYCNKRKVRLMDGFMWPHHPRTAEIKRLINDGVIGRVERVDGSFTFLLPLEPSNIRLQPEQGGGSLLDVGCYPIYGIRWAMGSEPVKVLATARFGYGVDLAMAGMLWFSEDRVAAFDCGFTLPMRQRLQITGSKGVVTVPQMWVPDARAEYEVQLGDGSPEPRSCPCPSQIVCMLEDFNAAVIEGRDPKPPATEAVKTLRVLDALAESARNGRVVELQG
jgi:predicted dehydrogenase